MNKTNTLKYLESKIENVIHEANNATNLLHDGESQNINEDADLVDIGFALDRLERAVVEAKQTLFDCDEY